MIIMALDHTRDFFHIDALTQDPLDPTTTHPWLYFTRWITHFCAPTFLLLSGVSAYLSSQKKSTTEASNFLIKRGLWLILMEITVITLALTFNPFFNFILLQVIWAIGASMVLLGIVTRFSKKAVLLIGIVLFFFHNITDLLNLPTTGPAGIAWQALLTARGTVVPLGATHFLGIFYTVLPWTGVMFTGYGLGQLYQGNFPAELRKKMLFYLGCALTALFVVLRFTKFYGDPTPFASSPNILTNIYNFFNTSKYPPSLQYCGMTLGPILILLSLTEQLKGQWIDRVSVYGKVPFFYYVLHFYVLHALTVVAFFACGYNMSQVSDNASIFLFRPASFGFSLVWVYVIWIAVVIGLYIPCKKFLRYKQTHQHPFLSYL